MRLLAASAFLFLILPARADPGDDFHQRLAKAAMEQTKEHVVYDGSYRRIPYPGGDVPRDRGVCTDVVIRAYRVLGLDLQVLVHEDMKANFSAYPQVWGLPAPDTNIDHRRVLNLQTFFRRKGVVLPVSREGKDYLPGDLVTFLVGPRSTLPHIGIVSAVTTEDGTRPLMVHNIGAGPQLEDMLFSYPITGHYRYPS